MMKERLMAIFIGLIMVFSIAGFAFNSVVHYQGPSVPEIPTVVTKKLNPQEILMVLRSGRVLIENVYTENCSECLERNAVLESFAHQFDGFVVLENVKGNKTVLQMIGRNGEIRDLTSKKINQSYLMDVFCDMAIAQPKECLLREI